MSKYRIIFPVSILGFSLIYMMFGFHNVGIVMGIFGTKYPEPKKRLKRNLRKSAWENQND